MKISHINNGNVNFTAGKTKILSDFDGTFMPKEFEHDVICNDNPPVDKDAFGAYFDKFKEFFEKQNNDKKKTELTISTGRNLYEFNYYMKKIKEKGLSIPNPDKLIITNGGDEFLKQGEDYFTVEKESMFAPCCVNHDKREQLKKFIVSYDPYRVLDQTKAFLLSLPNLPMLIEPKTHQGMYGYKDNMTLQEKVEEEGDITNYVSMRDDGAYQIRLTAPLESENLENLKKVSDELVRLGYDVDCTVEERDSETCVNTDSDPKKWDLGTSIDIKPTTSGKVKVLDKYHHAKLMADEIVENNLDDLVVVAGDGENDLMMLNLSNYIDSMGDFSEFTDSKFEEEVAKLPIVSIFVRNSSSLDDKIFEYEKVFNFDGKKRFIIVDKGNPERPQTLYEAIELAQNEYAMRNKEFEKEYRQ